VSAHITHRPGYSEDYAAEKIPGLIAELDAYDDDEHPDVFVSHSSGWTLSAFPSGLVIWEKLADDPDDEVAARHLRGISRDRQAELMTHCGNAEFDLLERLPWTDDYGS